MTNLNLPLERYQRLIEISRDLASTLNLDDLLQRIIIMAMDLVEAEASSILLYDERKNQLTFSVANDPRDQAVLAGIIVPPESIAGWVATNHEPVFVPDVHADARFFKDVEQALQFSTRSIIAVPMMARDRLIGVLEVLNKKRDVFNEADLGLLQALSAQAAVAIQNSRLFHQADLISELVHEIRTPLSAISTVAYLLQRPGMTDVQRLEMAGMIRQETERLNELASSFLDLARLESGRMAIHPVPINLAGLIDECCKVTRPKAEENGIVIRVQLPHQIPTIEVDPEKFKQVLLNLLSNAVKYNQPNGKVTMTVVVDEEELQIAVADTGVGIPAEALPHIGEKFFRAKNTEGSHPGTGLGLSICKWIVEAHGGRLTIESTVNVGTTFTVHLPVAKVEG